ncbi:MAG: FliM/FliN family flagellar motor switch protein [bacterium]|jgi:flagellar motor switch protein FliN
MAEQLTQEEIDALLQAGLGAILSDEKELERKEAKKSRAAAYSPTPFTSPANSGDKARKTGYKRTSILQEEVTVQPAVFQPFDDEDIPAEQTNLEIILNLNLEVRVELGKTTATVGEVLKMVKNSVLELNKLNGEPVDLLVNEKPFAKGEMIVIGENFGVRVTDILTVPEIIEALR